MILLSGAVLMTVQSLSKMSCCIFYGFHFYLPKFVQLQVFARIFAAN